MMKFQRYTLIAAVLLITTGCRLSAAPPAATVLPSQTASLEATTTPSSTTTDTPTLPPKVTSTTAPTNTPISVPTDTPKPTPTVSLPSEQGPFQPVGDTGSILPGTIIGLYASQDGAIWLVSEQGFARLGEDGWETHLTDLTGQLVWVDKSGQVWTLNEETNEISRWQGGEWTTYNREDGWQPILDWFAQVGSSETDSKGNLWLSTSQDVRFFDGESWETYIPEDMNMPPPEFEDVATEIILQVLENDEVWVGSCFWGGPGPFGGAGIRWYDGEAWQGANSPAAAGCVTKIEEDSQGHVWVALEDELWRYIPEREEWTRFEAPEPEEAQRYGYATEMVVDLEGNVWIILAECGGASCFVGTVPYRVQDGEWQQFANRIDAELWRLLLDSKGRIWIFSEAGISRIEDGEPSLEAQLFATHNAADPEGRLWIVTGIEAQQLLWVADNND